MTANKKILKSGALFLSVCLLAYAFYNYHQHKKYTYNFACSGNVLQKNELSNEVISVSVVFSMAENSHGVISLDGFYRSNNKEYVVRRTLNFTYSHFSSSLYKLSDKELIVGNRDTVPNDLLITNFSYVTINRISKIDSAFLIGTHIIPAFICKTG
ncbi:hypothetical protein ACQV2C_11205 [Pantoea allii]|uniref:hypothetical protein n=1 Tax=Pantoea allii TaxID=574096 RepID=UPI003D313630